MDYFVCFFPQGLPKGSKPDATPAPVRDMFVNAKIKKKKNKGKIIRKKKMNKKR